MLVVIVSIVLVLQRDEQPRLGPGVLHAAGVRRPQRQRQRGHEVRPVRRQQGHALRGQPGRVPR